MKSFKDFITEEYKQTHYPTAKEALAGMGKALFNAVIKHSTWESHQRAMRMGGEPKFDVTDRGAGSYKVEVGTHPYLTSFHMSHRGRGPAKIWAYHHMVARTDNPKEYMTLKTHGFDK